MKLYFIFEFQLVPFAFSLILGGLFVVSPPPPKVWGGGTFFKKKLVMGKKFSGVNLWGDCSTWGTNDEIMLREEEFHKTHFPEM